MWARSTVADHAEAAGKGTPRGWQGYSADAVLMFLRFWVAILAQATDPVVLSSSKTTIHGAQVTVFILPAAD
jgi:hypothetical protein